MPPEKWQEVARLLREETKPTEIVKLTGVSQAKVYEIRRTLKAAA